ncbi:MAG: MBL fold metallo-hydrolase [Myxococcaceae bacterium]|nr:MBL fold metallo-hydrolase [Myxococcaceae bacterium]
MSRRQTLRRDVSLAVLSRARTAADHHEDLGCSILGPASRTVRRAHGWLKREVQRLGEAQATAQARRLVQRLEATPAYRRLGTGRTVAGRLELKESVRFPDPRRFPPRVLHVRRGELAFDLDVKAAEWPAIADCCAALAQGLSAGSRRLFSRVPTVRTFLDSLTAARWLEPHDGAAALPAAGFTFVGHNTTLVRDGGASVLVDPYFRPMSAIDLPSYPPMHARDLGHVDAVCITHSHGDHFHLGSLLTLPRDTRIFVPPVERESLFSTDCVARLEQLGFSRVEAPGWHTSQRVGPLTVHALPFYGEQPTAGRGVYAGLFNEGSTWLVRGPTASAAFFADSGDDVRGSMRDVCALARRGGPVDVLFCGVRGFRLKPIFFGFTTLDAYLVNVPRSALTTTQQLMASPREALELAARLGARTLVPCADGGAPWYWREGMGPKYPGYPGEPVDGASWHEENPDADPYPERVEAARRPDDARVVVLRPGEALDAGGRRPVSGFAWPFEALS